MGSLLLAAGEPNHRRILPNARVMIHQPSGGTRGVAADIAIHAREILDLRARLNAIYSIHTGKPVSEIETSMERDNFMTSVQAMEFGIVDEITRDRKSVSIRREF